MLFCIRMVKHFLIKKAVSNMFPQRYQPVKMNVAAMSTFYKSGFTTQINISTAASRVMKTWQSSHNITHRGYKMPA